MSDQPTTCGHCGKPIEGSSRGYAQGVVLCHSGVIPPWREPWDCYRLLTIYGVKLGDLSNTIKRIT